MTFVGAFLTNEHEGAVHHRAERAWIKFWSARRHLLTKALPLRCFRFSRGEPWRGTWRAEELAESDVGSVIGARTAR